jgi:hypothetical protein
VRRLREEGFRAARGVVAVSARTGEGVRELWGLIEEALPRAGRR